MGKRGRRRRDSGTKIEAEIEAVLATACSAVGHAATTAMQRLAYALATDHGAGAVTAVVDRSIRTARFSAGDRGWTALDLSRATRRQSKRLGAAAALIESGSWQRGPGTDAIAAVRAAVLALTWLRALPPLPAEALTAGLRADRTVLDRVLALLAKAESTTFPAEAEALTAKAQELMAKHAIDEAVLAEGRPRGAVGCRRIALEEPYSRARAQLLAAVARANRCRIVVAEPFGFAAVFGFANDLEAVEVLHASLAVQASTAMLAAGDAEAGDRTRSRGFRQAFLVSFASRMGERLEEVTAAAVAEAIEARGESLLPVLAARADAVDEAVADAFPLTTTTRVSSSDGAGWAAGRRAADRAHLGRSGVAGPVAFLPRG